MTFPPPRGPDNSFLFIWFAVLAFAYALFSGYLPFFELEPKQYSGALCPYEERCGGRNRCLLRTAVARNDLVCMWDYLSQMGNTNLGDDILCYAIESGTPDAVYLLLEFGADPRQAGLGCSPLLRAVEKGHVSLLEKLLQSREEILSDSYLRNTLVSSAVKSDDVKTLQLLQQYGVKIDEWNRADISHAPLCVAMEYGKDDMFQYLLDQGANVTEPSGRNQNAPLHFAAERGYIRYLKPLVDRGAKVYQQNLLGFTPIHLACEHNRDKALEVLMDLDTSRMPGHERENVHLYNRRKLFPLHVAASKGFVNILEVLVSGGGCAESLGTDDMTRLLMDAIANNDFGDFNFRLFQPKGWGMDAGCVDIDAKNSLLKSPMDIAAENGHFEFVLALYSEGARARRKTLRYSDDGTTLLQHAVQLGRLDIVRSLLETVSTVEETDYNGLAALHVASMQRQEGIAHHLIEQGANINALTTNGRTPLHLAVEARSLPLAELLISKGADKSLRSDGETALDIAKRLKYSEFTSLLSNEHESA